MGVGGGVGGHGDGAGANDLPPWGGWREWGAGHTPWGAGCRLGEAYLPALLPKMGLKKDILFGLTLCVLSPFMIHQ